MQDLNDLYYYHAVVTHGGFSAAARQLICPKSTLSKRVAKLERELSVRLLERSTRGLRTTDVGQRFFEQCEAMLGCAERAITAVAQSHGEPSGIVRVSCPQGLIQHMMVDLLPAFMKRYPSLRIQWRVLNRPADLIEDRVDIALRVRTVLDGDNSLIVRPLGRGHLIMVASPHLWLEQADEDGGIARLEELPKLSMTEEADDDEWELVGPDGGTHTLRHRPRLACSNFDLLRAAAIEALGVAQLPERVCRAALASGELVHVLPGWHSPTKTVQAVFSSRKGMLPSVRALVDYLAVAVPPLIADTPSLGADSMRVDAIGHVD